MQRDFALRSRPQVRHAVYVYDGDLIVQRYRELYEFFSWPKLRVLYAMKANFNPAVLKLLREAGAGIDASARVSHSGDEVRFSGGQILFHRQQPHRT